ncbi:TPA: hypothetical protein HA265_00590 [Candidatus Woesearchaeota archaeon]|nr:hypothetical protein [Candidatus Woesearchaeota archaeon]
MYKIIIPMVLALTSIIFLGSGISGFVVADNTGAITKPYNWGVLLSLLFLIASMLSFFLLNRKR